MKYLNGVVAVSMLAVIVPCSISGTYNRESYCIVRAQTDERGKMKLVRSGTGCADEIEGANKLYEIFNEIKAVMSKINEPTLRPTSRNERSSSNSFTSRITSASLHSTVAIRKTDDTSVDATSSAAKTATLNTPSATTQSIDSTESSGTTEETTTFSRSFLAGFSHTSDSSFVPFSTDLTATRDTDNTSGVAASFTAKTATQNAAGPTTQSFGSTESLEITDEGTNSFSPFITSFSQTSDSSFIPSSTDLTTTTDTDTTLIADADGSANIGSETSTEGSNVESLMTETTVTIEDQTTASGWLESSGEWWNITCETVLRLKTGNTTLRTTPASEFEGSGFCEIMYCGICFWAVIEHATLDQAHYGCQMRGAALANVYSKQHLDIIFEYLLQNRTVSYIWTGMKYNVTLGEVTLRNGLPAPYVRWAPGQPNMNAQNLNIDLDVPNDGMWNYHPDASDDGYICEL